MIARIRAILRPFLVACIRPLTNPFGLSRDDRLRIRREIEEDSIGRLDD